MGYDSRVFGRREPGISRSRQARSKGSPIAWPRTPLVEDQRAMADEKHEDKKPETAKPTEVCSDENIHDSAEGK